MEEKKQIKISLGTVILILIIFLLLIVIGILCYKTFIIDKEKTTLNNMNSFQKNETKETNSVTNNISGANIPETNTSVVKKLDNSKDIVYTSFNAVSNEYSYELPTINIDSSDVNQINSKIQSDYKTIIDEEIANVDEGLSVSMYAVKYNSYINNNILSLVINCEYPSDNIYYQVYNIDIYTGKPINNIDLLKSKNINETTFLSRLPELYKNKFVEKYGTKDSFVSDYAEVGLTEAELKEQEELYEEQYNKTINTNNYNIETPIFLDSNNTINIIAEIHSLAGAKSYYHIIKY